LYKPKSNRYMRGSVLSAAALAVVAVLAATAWAVGVTNASKTVAKKHSAKGKVLTAFIRPGGSGIVPREFAADGKARRAAARTRATARDAVAKGSVKPLIEAAWKVEEPPAPTGASASNLEDGVSCTSSTACTAVGDFHGSSGEVPLADRWNGTTWSAEEPPLPTGATGNPDGGVSCASSTSCIAVGEFTNGSGEFVPLAETWNGTAWSVHEPPSPSGAKAAYLNGGISCASPTVCVAAGMFVNSSGETVPLAETWNGTTWTIDDPTVPAGAKTSSLNGVSCTSSTACTGVGIVNSSGVIVPLAERWNGTTWSAEEPPAPTGAKASELQDVSCVSPTACMAVGEFESSSGTSWEPLTELWNGTTWSVQEMPSPNDGATLNSVSCTSETACTAVGRSTSAPVVESWNGTTWSVGKPIAESTFSPLSGGVSCTSVCIAVGEFVNGVGTTVPLAEED
jgi:hypothetical protein